MRFFVFALLAVVAVSAVQERDTDEKKCAPNKLFRRVCNDCICTPDGKSAVCTKRECLEGHPDVEIIEPSGVKICPPLSVFKIECNDCRCSSNGLDATCTTKICPTSEVISDIH